jgi:hypothetical protein
MAAGDDGFPLLEGKRVHVGDALRQAPHRQGRVLGDDLVHVGLVQHHAEENEKVLIGKEITIVVVEIRGAQIRLGIQAPADLLILREKLVGAAEL